MPDPGYPPGVTGNEPEITGVWPPDALADYCHSEAAKARRLLEDLEGVLDDQGALPHVEDEMGAALAATQALVDAAGRIAPPEVDPDEQREREAERENDRYMEHGQPGGKAG